ncbi:hypothetical protein D3C85_1787150 [compost metagenome]
MRLNSALRLSSRYRTTTASIGSPPPRGLGSGMVKMRYFPIYMGIHEGASLSINFASEAQLISNFHTK